jgi:hypothetical protein
MPVVPSGGGGGFRRLLSRPMVPPGAAVTSGSAAPAPAPAPAPPATAAAPPSTGSAPAGGGDGDMRTKFRQRGKMVRASVGSGAAVPPSAAALAAAGGVSGGSLPVVPMVGGGGGGSDDDMVLHDDDFDAGMRGRGGGVARAGSDGERADASGKLVQSFVPLPGSRYGPSAALAGAAASGAGAGKMPSPERDLALVHALRRSELRSRGGDGATPRSPAGVPAGGAAAGKPAVSPVVTARGGAGGGAAVAPPAPAVLPPPSPELSMQLTATAVLEAQEDLLNAHMAAIQENADLLTQEGKLLAGVQSGSADDFDIDAYASKLQSLLTRKLRTTQALLGQLSRLRDQWDREELLHKTLGEADFDL